MKKMYQKIAEIKKHIGKISKDSENPFHKSKYFDINKLLEHVEPLLQEHGLLLIQPIENGSVVTRIIDIDEGVNMTSAIPLPKIDDPQKIGSCISYYRRYSLSSLLAIQSEDDDAQKTMQPEKPWLNEGKPEWKEALKFIANGGTVAEIKKKYRVSKKSEVKLV